MEAATGYVESAFRAAAQQTENPPGSGGPDPPTRHPPPTSAVPTRSGLPPPPPPPAHHLSADPPGTQWHGVREQSHSQDSGSTPRGNWLPDATWWQPDNQERWAQTSGHGEYVTNWSRAQWDTQGNHDHVAWPQGAQGETARRPPPLWPPAAQTQSKLTQSFAYPPDSAPPGAPTAAALQSTGTSTSIYHFSQRCNHAAAPFVQQRAASRRGTPES